VAGEKVATPVAENLAAGSYNVRFEAGQLASGVYFYKLEWGNSRRGPGKGFSETRKMVLLR